MLTGKVKVSTYQCFSTFKRDSSCVRAAVLSTRLPFKRQLDNARFGFRNGRACEIANCYGMAIAVYLANGGDRTTSTVRFKSSDRLADGYLEPVVTTVRFPYHPAQIEISSKEYLGYRSILY